MDDFIQENLLDFIITSLRNLVNNGIYIWHK